MMQGLLGRFLQESPSVWLDRVPSPMSPSERGHPQASSLCLSDPRGGSISLLGFSDPPHSPGTASLLRALCLGLRAVCMHVLYCRKKNFLKDMSEKLALKAAQCNQGGWPSTARAGISQGAWEQKGLRRGNAPRVQPAFKPSALCQVSALFYPFRDGDIDSFRHIPGFHRFWKRAGL